MKWFQGAPSLIPRLSCSVKGHGYGVSRLDKDGLFVFADEKVYGENFLKGELEIELNFRKKKAPAKGQVIRVLGQGHGYGIKFEGMSSDQWKELGDFVETIKGEGYAV